MAANPTTIAASGSVARLTRSLPKSWYPAPSGGDQSWLLRASSIVHLRTRLRSTATFLPPGRPSASVRRTVGPEAHWRSTAGGAELVVQS